MTKDKTAPVFDLQRFSIHDGPGIRTLVFIKGCNFRCEWCQNPESQDAKPLIGFYEDRCDNSMQCKDVCEENAILNTGYRVDHDRCNLCLRCVDACPHDALKLIGDEITSDALFQQILADKAYYQCSQGGVTFSGGEVTLYPKFMSQIVSRCFEDNIHITIETCGSYAYTRWEPIFKKIQLIYFDLKIMDDATHHLATGSSNQHILENARILAVNGYPVEFRLALIEGYTDGPDNLDAIVAFLNSVKHTKLHLLRYHNMGQSKIDLIKGGQKKLTLANYDLEKFQKIKDSFVKQGLDVIDTS